MTLLGRNLLLLQRTWRQTLGVLIQFIAMGLTVGYIYANLGEDVIGATDRVALLYNCSSIVPFLVILSAIAKGMQGWGEWGGTFAGATASWATSSTL